MDRLKFAGLVWAVLVVLGLLPAVGLQVSVSSAAERFAVSNPAGSAAFLAPVVQETGWLEGYVTAADGGTPLEAIVTAGDGTWTTSDPATGHYIMVLDAGTHEVTAEAPGFAGQTAQVTVPPGASAQQNFALEIALIVQPDPITLTLPWSETGTVSAVMTNNLDVDYPFEFLEADEATSRSSQTPGILLLGDDVVDDAGGWQIYRQALVAAGAGWDEWNLDALPFPTPADLAPYSILIVFDESTLAYGDAECQILSDWLASGGKGLFSTSIDWLRDLADGVPGAGEHNLYLQFETTYVDSAAGSGIVDMEGVPGDLVGGEFSPPNTLSLAGTSESGGDYANQYQSAATVGLLYGQGGAGSGFAGLTHYESGSYRTVWLGANFHNGLTDQAQRNDLMENVLSFFAGVDVPWYGTSVVSGTVPAGSSLGWRNALTATLEAGIDQPGEYRARLRIRPRLPGGTLSGAGGLPSKDVEVLLSVLPSATTGRVAGTVTGDRPGGPLAAELLIEHSQGVTWSIATEPTTGYFAQWLDQGAYQLTAGAPGYVPEAVGVVITAGQTTTQNIELALLAPEIRLSPPYMAHVLPAGDVTVQTLAISNAGLLPLHFQVGEQDRGLIPAGSSLLGVQGARILYDDSHGGDPTAYGDLMAGLSARSAVVEMISTGPLDEALLTGYDVLWVPDDLDVPFTAAELNDITTWVQGGSGLFVNFDCCDEATAPALAALFDVVYMGSGGNGGVTINVYPHATTAGVSSVYLPGPYQYLATAGTAEIVVADTGGMGQVAVNEVGGRVVVVGDDAFDDGLYQQNDNALLAMNAFDWLAGGEVPWLHQFPVSDTVPVSNTIGVQIALDAGAVPEAGTYLASLRVRSNDPYQNLVAVPVTMTVLNHADLGWLEGTITGMGYCDSELYPLEAETVAQSDTGPPWTATSDPATGYYARWLPAGAYTVTASAPVHASRWTMVQITAGQTTTLDMALRYLAPCLELSPPAFTVTVPANTQQEAWLSLGNRGTTELSWTLQEAGDSGGDVPWVSEVPTHGLVAGDSVAGVQITFDAAVPGVVAGECYTAGLNLFHDDPDQGNPVPIPMRLCAEACTEVTAVSLSTLTDEIVAGIALEFEADILPDGATAPYSYRFDPGDGTPPVTGGDNVDPLSFHHTYALPGTYTPSVEVWNCGLATPVRSAVPVDVLREGRYHLPIILKNN